MDIMQKDFVDIAKLFPSDMNSAGTSDIAPIMDFAVVCAFCGIEEACTIQKTEMPFDTIRSLGAEITNAGDIIKAGALFVKAFMGFYQVDESKLDEETKKKMAELRQKQ